MNHKLHIAYANRPDLLQDAVESTRDIGNLHLWPNNGAPDTNIANVTVHRLPEMSAVGVINMMIQSSWDDDVMFWAHNDCYAHPGAARRLFDKVMGLQMSGARWGVQFGLYDILCAFNMKAVREVGYWDPMFFQYTADVDFYYRMHRADWPVLDDFDKSSIEHRGSMTVRSDPLFNHRTQWRARKRFDNDYYHLKWGGFPGQEKFARPFEDFRP